MCAGLTILGLLASPSASAEPVLRAADVAISMTGATSCDVKATFTIDGADPGGIEHRVQAPDGVRVELLAAGGSPPDPDAVTRQGVTLAYVWRPSAAQATYELSYRVSSTDEWPYRCPLWLPTVPTDGRSRSVRLEVHLPPGAIRHGGTLPAFTWSGTRGVATIGHLPAFVRVPHEAPGDELRGTVWDLSAAMDNVAVLVMAGATVFWIWRRGRTRRQVGGPASRGPRTGRV